MQLEIARWKAEFPSVFQAACGEMRLNDAIIDWVDLIFEQVGNASRCPPHSHTWFEFNYVLTGEMKTRFADRLITIQAGDFFLIPPGLVHSHLYKRGQPHEGICLRWRLRPADGSGEVERADAVGRVPSAPGDAERWDMDGRVPSAIGVAERLDAGGRVLSAPGAAGGGRTLTADVSAGAAPSLYQRLHRLHHWRVGGYRDVYGIGGILLDLFAEADKGVSRDSTEASGGATGATFASGRGSPLAIQLHLARLLDALTRVPGGHAETQQPGADGSRDNLLRKVDLYLEDFQGERLNVGDLAASLHMSYGHLSRLYKQRTGQTLVERMNRIRLDKACALLRGDPAIPVQEAAAHAGFPDLSYFSKLFKKVHGVSPAAYRNRSAASSREAENGSPR